MNVISALLLDNTGIHIDYVMYTITLQPAHVLYISRPVGRDGMHVSVWLFFHFFYMYVSLAKKC